MFTILHYPLVLGIILYAVAAKTAVAHPSEPLSQTGLIALSAGVAAFLLGSVAIRWRGIHVVAGERFVAGMVIPGGLILLRELPAVALMAVAVAALALPWASRRTACAPFGPRSGRPDASVGQRDVRRREGRSAPADAASFDQVAYSCSARTAFEARGAYPCGMERRRITSGSPYERTVGFSRAIRVGDRVLVSGTAPIWPDGSCDPDPEVQAARCLTIILLRWPRPGGPGARRPDAELPRPPSRRGSRVARPRSDLQPTSDRQAP